MELKSNREEVLVHYKDGQPAAMTHFNGRTDIFKLSEPMTRKEIEDFYETNTSKQV